MYDLCVYRAVCVCYLHNESHFYGMKIKQTTHNILIFAFLFFPIQPFFFVHFVFALILAGVCGRMCVCAALLFISSYWLLMLYTTMYFMPFALCTSVYLCTYASVAVAFLSPSNQTHITVHMAHAIT